MPAAKRRRDEPSYIDLRTKPGRTLMAGFGWKAIGEAQRYIEEANRIKLADNAAAKIIAGTDVGSPSNPVSQNEAQPVEK